VDDHFHREVLLAALEELEFTVLFEVEEEHDDRDDDAGNKSNEGEDGWNPNGGEWELEPGDATGGDV
jgi:hypothetical protein